jgi:tetratricopeptide (TPR) repeat protein
MTSRPAPTGAFALLAILAGCGGSSRSAPTAASPPAAADGELDLAALARSIDPGEVPPLGEDAPPLLRQAFDASDGSSVPLDQLVSQAESVAGALIVNATGIDLGRVMTLVYMADQMEHRMSRCELDCLAAAERVYAAADVPWLADPDAFLGELLSLAALTRTEMAPEQAKPIFDYLQRAFTRAPLRHRFVAARILRSAPASPAATAALRTLARRAEREGDYRLAVQLRQTVVARAPLGFDDLADLAGSCILAERIPCVQEAMVRARASSGGHPEKLGSLERDLAATRRIIALAGAREEGAELERAHLLVDVGRRQQAIVLLDRLAAAHPRDARPLVGLARAWFADAKTTRSGELVARARPLEHKEERFYELAIGLTFQRLMGLFSGGSSDPDKVIASIVGALPQLQADVEELARFKPGVGGVLRVVVGRLKEGATLIGMTDATARRKLLTALTAGALDEALALHARMPGDADVYRLLYLVARFTARPGATRAAAIEVPPGVTGRDELLLMRAGLLYSFAVSWTDSTRIAEIDRTLEALSATGSSGPVARVLRADTLALEARMLGRAERWPDVATAYRALLEEAAPEERPRLQNNLGVALWESGDREGARAAWADALAAGEPHQVARLNQTATAEAADLAALDQIADGSDRVGVQVQALHWKIARAKLRGAARRRAMAQAARLLGSTTVSDASDGSTGVVLEESFNVGIGYSSRDRLLVQLSLGRAAFLLVPAPRERTRVTDASRTRRRSRP